MFAMPGLLLGIVVAVDMDLARREVAVGAMDPIALPAPTCLPGEEPCADVCDQKLCYEPASDQKLCYEPDAVKGALSPQAKCGCEAQGGLCDRFLYVAYTGETAGGSVDDAEGMWRLAPGHWGCAELVSKKSREGGGECTHKYTAVCTTKEIKPHIKVATTCCSDELLGGEVVTKCDPESVETRPLERNLDPRSWAKSSGTDFKPSGKNTGEYAMDVFDPQWRARKLFGTGSVNSLGQPKADMVKTAFGTLTKATRVSWAVGPADKDSSAPGQAELRKIPRKAGTRQGWQVDAGCYCCKHGHSVLDSPFAGDREAWTKTGAHWEEDGMTVEEYGTQECMLAWSELPQGDSPFILPRLLVFMIDYLTLWVGSHAACGYTCSYGLAPLYSGTHTHSYRKL